MNQASINNAAESGDVIRYAFRQSLVGAPSEFILRDRDILWNSGLRSFEIPYRDIKQVRLVYRPVTMQSYRFVAEVKTRAGIKFTIASTSWRSLTEHEKNDEAYRTFIVELHRRLAAAGGSVTYLAGAPAFLYWLGLSIFAGLMLTTASLAFRAIQAGDWQAALFVIAMLSFFLWQTVRFFGRNKPGSYTPDMLPAAVLP